MSRVLVLAESALAAPFAGFGDVEVFPEFHQKAAIYGSRIIRYHPLPDGNKRAAYDVMREFIERNGGSFVHGPGGLMETAEVIERVAAGTMGERAFIDWVGERIRRPRDLTEPA